MTVLTGGGGVARNLALRLCGRIGADPAGPIGQRLGDRCAGLAPDALAALEDALAAGGPAHAGDLIDRLFDEATNRETYFFRDRGQLQLLLALLAERRIAAPDIWSAGCASGEEAYSVAILASVHGGFARTSVLGTDLSPAALAVAEQAVYRTGPMSACRTLTPDDERFLPPAGERSRRVAADIRARVRFRSHNIVAGPPEASPFDAILCRNVLIYMDHAGRRGSLATLDAALKPGGVLVIGPGDSVPPTDPVSLGYRPVYRNNALAFVKEPADAPR